MGGPGTPQALRRFFERQKQDAPPARFLNAVARLAQL
jgi:hypothetical protein